MIRLCKRLFLTLSGLLAISGCSGIDVFNFITPRTGYSIVRDIPYGEKTRQRLDIYIPDKKAPASPVIVFFYGGSWQMGSKEQYKFVAQAFASKGFITVIADYRLYPEVYFPAFVEDGAKAFAWVHNNISQYGGDPKNVFLSGHSAGGYIAIMLAINEHYIAEQGGNRSWIKGAIGIAGPYDFLPFTDPKIKALFSKSDDAATQPINFVGPHLSPILLLTGDKDIDVYPKNAINLTAKLQEFNDPVTFKTYHGVAHIGIALALANGFRGRAPVLEDISSFVQGHSQK